MSQDRPTDSARWATDPPADSITAPTSDQLDSGWQPAGSAEYPSGKPNRQNFNWWQNLVGKTLQWLMQSQWVPGDILSDQGIAGTGSAPTTGASLSIAAENFSSSAVVGGFRIDASGAKSPAYTYGASKDVYWDLAKTGAWTATEVANGAGAPSVAAASVRIFKVVTDGTGRTSVVDFRLTPVALKDVRTEDMEPIADNTHALGTTSKRYSDVKSNLMHVTDQNGFAFAAAVTEKHWISGNEFVLDNRDASNGSFYANHTPMTADGGTSGAAGHGVLEIQGGSTGPYSATASIKLPQGAIITGMTLNAAVFQVVTPGDAIVGVIRQKLAINASTPLRQSLISAASPSGDDPASIAAVNLANGTTPITLAVDQNLTIDNSTWKYLILVESDSGANARIFLSNLLVTYTIGAIRPS